MKKMRETSAPCFACLFTPPSRFSRGPSKQAYRAKPLCRLTAPGPKGNLFLNVAHNAHGFATTSAAIVHTYPDTTIAL